jgi:hypothetical protein
VKAKDPFNLPEEEFETVMVEIDEKLRKRSDRIPGREMGGIAEYCAKFKLTLSSTHPTTKRIIDWFERTYGDRLKMNWDFGRSIVFILGDLYRIRCLRFYGTALFVCSPDLLGKRLGQRVDPGRIHPVRNLLESGIIEGFTQSLAARLSPKDCAEILRAYGRMFNAFSGLEASLDPANPTNSAPYIAANKLLPIHMITVHMAGGGDRLFSGSWPQRHSSSSTA